MRGARAAVVGAASTAVLAALAASAGATDSKHCAPGSKPATVAGKHRCLKPGAACDRGHDAAYHRHRFHCHNGRLTRFAAPARPAPAPPPPPPAPPTLAEPPAPAGSLVDVGGYRLHLECAGSGAPAVVIETGQMATRLNYRKVQYALAAETRVCTYDRPGTDRPQPAASDARPAGVQPTAETFTRELRTVLANGGVTGPYVLVGTSLGGLLVSSFASRHPEEVAGLVFLDAIAPGNVASWQQVLLASTEPWDGRADVERLRALSFGSKPVVIVSTAQPGETADLRGRATSPVVAAAPQWGHFVFVEAPGLAFEAIRVALAAARSGATPACSATRLPQIGARCE